MRLARNLEREVNKIRRKVVRESVETHGVRPKKKDITLTKVSDVVLIRLFGRISI